MRPVLRIRQKAARGAEVVPFPAVLRRRFIAKNAAAAVRYSEASGEKYIDHLLSRHLTRLFRLGISADLAEADAKALGEAVRLHSGHLRLRRKARQ